MASSAATRQEQDDGEPAPGSPPDHPARTRVPWYRQALPFVLAAGLIVYVLGRIDWATFWTQLGRVNYPAFVGFMVVFIVSLLFADTLATVYVYRLTVAPVAHREFFVIRGASYLPSTLNHHVGQAWLTYFLSRAYQVRLGRVAGATLVAYATWGGCVLGLGCVAMLAAGLAGGWLAVPLGLGLAYLVLLAIRPRLLAKNRVLAPLFEAGVVGHITAMALRLPHMAVLFVGTWLSFWFFDVQVPLGAALTYVPILLVAITVPITPQGFGTRDVLAATFFEAFVATEGLGHEQRLAVIAAATTTQGVVIALIGIAIGLALLPRSSRLLRQERAKAGAAPPTA